MCVCACVLDYFVLFGRGDRMVLQTLLLLRLTFFFLKSTLCVPCLFSGFCI